MDEVQELIERLEDTIGEYYGAMRDGDDARDGEKLVAEAKAALTKALTVSPEKLSKARRAMMTTPGPGKALCSDFTDLEIEALARAAAIALGLIISD